MDRAAHSLDIAWKMTHEFASSANTRRSIERGLDYARNAVSAEAASFFRLSTDQKSLTCIACHGPADIIDQTVPAHLGIIGTCTQSQKSRLIADTHATSEFSNIIDAQSGFETRSMICVPVSGQKTRYGAIQLINRIGGNGRFDNDDLALAEVLANAAALALSNSQLTQTMLANAALRRDLDMAARVQASLLPSHREPSVHGINIPMNTVSGDLYDYFRHDGDLFFCMGDVAGKGIDAALVMAKTHSLFRALARNNPRPHTLIAAINRELLATSFEGRFVTLIIGMITLKDGQVRLCNAGHEPSFVIDDTKNKAAMMLPPTLPPLAIIPIEAEDIQPYEFSLARNARLYCYSDGVSEARINNTPLGIDGLIKILKKNRDKPLDKQIEIAICDIQQRADHVHDDLTLLGIKNII